MEFLMDGINEWHHVSLYYSCERSESPLGIEKIVDWLYALGKELKFRKEASLPIFQSLRRKTGVYEIQFYQK